MPDTSHIHDTSHLAEAPLDPARPWITDPEDLPSRMRWGATLLNPFGQTSRVHFTRAWTVLFFARVLTFILPMFFGWIISAAGGDGSGISGTGTALFGLTFVLTIFLSLVLHIRRLSDAGRKVLDAGVVFMPVIAALTVFLMVGSANMSEHEGLVAQYEIDKADPEAAEATYMAEQAASGKETAEIRPYELRNPGPVMAYVIAKTGSLAGIAWAVTALCIMLWTLLWVARLPSARLRAELEANAQELS